MKSILAAAALLLFGSAPNTGAAGPTDFVVEQVCIDAADRPVPGDPMLCPKARMLRIGETIPYRRADAGNWQALYSYPVAGLGGETRAMAAKVFGGADTSGSFGDLGVRSGYDLIEVGERYVSIIRTSDQGGGDQIFWRSADCTRADGWILFPPGLQPGERGDTRSSLKITPGPSTACPRLGDIGPDFTAWERPVEPYHYTGGKELDTIETMHFAYGIPSNPAHDDDSMEKFYFTKPYGFSRWEAWETPTGCRRRAERGGRDPAEACRPSSQDICNGPNTATFYGKLYWRLDCRDSISTVADPGRGFNPLVSSAAPGDVLNRNLLDNGTFFDGADHWSPSGALTVAPEREPGLNNSLLRLSGGSGTLGQVFSIPADMQAPGRLVRWGASLAAAGAAAAAHLALTLTPVDGPEVRIEHPLGGGATLRATSFVAPLPNGDGKPIAGRFELVVGPGAAGLRVDDAFVALLDPSPPGH